MILVTYDPSYSNYQYLKCLRSLDTGNFRCHVNKSVTVGNYSIAIIQLPLAVEKEIDYNATRDY